MTSGQSTGRKTTVSCAAARSPASDADDRRPQLRAFVEDRKRKLELAGLPDGEPLVARLAEHPPRPLGERLAAKPRERLRRPEPRRRAADEQHAREPGHRTTRSACV